MTQITSATHGLPAVAPALQFRFRIVAEVAQDIPLDTTSAGELLLIHITGGPVTGDLEGSVVAGGADWCLHKSPGTYRVEARYGIRAANGSYVDVVNTGLLTRPDEGAHTPGRPFEYFMTTPEFRTTDPELAWLTRSVFVGRAFAAGGATTIDVFEVLAPNPAD